MSPHFRFCCCYKPKDRAEEELIAANDEATEVDSSRQNNMAGIRMLTLCEQGHLGLSRAASEVAPTDATMESLDISNLPLFDAGSEKNGIPKAVELLIQKVNDADVVAFVISDSHHLISTTLKTAIDWLATSKVLDAKPGGVYGAGDPLGNHKAQLAFRHIAASLNVRLLVRPELCIPGSSLSPTNGDLVDEKIKERLADFYAKLNEWAKTLKATPHPPRKIKVYGISGSLRKASANTGLLRAAAHLLPDQIDFEIGDIKNIPMYNGDVEAAGIPPAVQVFIDKIKSADALVFATPEYNYGIAGPIKNAIDWASRKDAFAGKPGIVIGSGGIVGSGHGQYSFKQSMIYPGMNLVPSPQYYGYTYGGGVDLATGDLTDGACKAKLKQSMEALFNWTIQLNHPPATPVNSVSQPVPDLVIEQVSKISPSWEAGKIKILGIAGSTRSGSFNKGLLRAAAENAPTNVQIQIADISQIPHFDNDLESAGVPQSVQNFVDHLLSADAVLIAATENNYCYSAVLKNAIDWASRQSGFQDKPVALVGAGGPDGTSNSQSLLRIMGCELKAKFLVNPTYGVCAFIPGNFDHATGNVTNPTIKEDVKKVVVALAEFTTKLKAAPQQKPTKVVVIPGSANHSTLTGGILRSVQANIPSDITIEVVDPSTLPTYTSLKDEIPDTISGFVDHIKAADAVLLISPEYNNSLSSITKNALDWAIKTRALEGKPMSSLGYGDHLSGYWALWHVRQVAAAGLGLFYDADRVQIDATKPDIFDGSSGDIKDEELKTRIHNNLKGLRDWAATFHK